MVCLCDLAISGIGSISLWPPNRAVFLKRRYIWGLLSLLFRKGLNAWNLRWVGSYLKEDGTGSILLLWVERFFRKRESLFAMLKSFIIWLKTPWAVEL